MGIPDILTHLLTGLSIGLVLRGTIRDEISQMIMLGSILIDIERPLGWIIELLGMNINIFGLTEGFHSILGALLLSFAAASLFDDEKLSRNSRFWFVFLGTTSHLLLDMTLWPWPEQGLYLLFPLKIPFSFNLFWPDLMYYPLLGFGILLIAIFYCTVIERIRPTFQIKKP